MQSVVKQSSYQQLLTADLQISQMWRKDQYGVEGITFFLIFVWFKFYNHFFQKIVENEKNVHFLKIGKTVITFPQECPYSYNYAKFQENILMFDN